MKFDSFRVAFLSLIVSVACSATASLNSYAEGQAIASASGSNVPVADMRITGPISSGNLSVFFIHGKDQLKVQNYLTLQEALEQKKVVVHETGDVNQLKVDNLSDSIVFIQSGDIVKGGRQDRTMQNDLLLQPKAKSVSLDAFCVEHGRWSQRAHESSDQFASSSYALAGKSIKLAAKREASQSAVWNEVSSNQAKLSRSLAKPVAASASPSSYELTLENKVVKEATNKLVNDLLPTINKDNDIVGYAFAINGRVNSADVYASSTLFKKLWPKLLNSSATEAVAEKSKDQPAKPATIDDVKSCLLDAEKAPKATQYDRDSANFKVESKEDARNIMFSTQDKAARVTVHKNYVTKF